MPNRTPKSTNLRRLKPAAVSNPRFEVVFERKVWPKPSFDGLFSRLKTLGERSGGAVEDAYARVAGSVLDWFERQQDADAER